MQINENKQLNIQQKQNYPGSVASYDSWPGNEVGLFYNGPERHTGLAHNSFGAAGITDKYICLQSQGGPRGGGVMDLRTGKWKVAGTPLFPPFEPTKVKPN